jgi:hypothetical protein
MTDLYGFYNMGREDPATGRPPPPRNPARVKAFYYAVMKVLDEANANAQHSARSAGLG